MLNLLILLLSVPQPAGAQTTTPVAATRSAASGDFSGLVDIGDGCRLWLECRGAGSPTVVLEGGAGNDAGIWDTVALLSGSAQTAVLPRDGGARGHR